MEFDNRPAYDGERHEGLTLRPRSQLFAVRLWKEAGSGGWEYRGSVRDLASGAFAGFTDWSNLIAFLVARLEEQNHDQAEPIGGGLE